MTATAEKIEAKRRLTLEPGLWYNTEEVANAMQCSKIKLEIWRQKGGGIRFSKFGRQIRYLGKDVLDYLESNSGDNTSEISG
jgi:hypothetical protein